MTAIIIKPSKTIVYNTYWKFAAKRQEVFWGKLYGHQGEVIPKDPILMKHRFTNAYRASDRVSQYLIKNVQYNEKWSPKDLLFRTILFKIFNKIETWEHLEQKFGKLIWDNFSFTEFDNSLSALKKKSPIYSAAYIMPSGKSVFGFAEKHKNHLKLIQKIMNDQTLEKLRGANSLEAVYMLMKSFPTIGSFTGFQYTIDLNYSPLFEFEESDFVVPGPGALDGISKCFSDFGSYSPSDIIYFMCDVQEEEFAKNELNFKDLWGRPLKPIDCQNLFCEVDKYSRVAHPYVPGRSGRTRIKQVYKPAKKKVEFPFYPPKWKINEKIEADRNLITQNLLDHQEQRQMSLLIDHG